MKTYCYNEPVQVNGTEQNVVTEYTEKEILDDYWDYWYTAMVKKYE